MTKKWPILAVLVVMLLVPASVLACTAESWRNN